jgi:hypothetical protein
MPWLLDPSRPNLHWRVLTDLIHRPPDSPAVVRARGGADAVDPVASLLEDLMPDGSWVGGAGLWEKYSGPGWRLWAAVQWGADPSDPRLHAASLRLLEEAPGTGGFAVNEGREPAPWLTARVLQGLARLGWCRHSRFQEAVAWLDEAALRSLDGGWIGSGGGGESVACGITPVALLDALTVSGDANRAALRERAVRAVFSTMAAAGPEFFLLGHPNIDRTDAAEALSVLARAGAALDPEIVAALSRLQGLQGDGGKWERGVDVPVSLPVGGRPKTGEPSKWITLAAATAILHYAVDAGLPRRFPQKPS